jgi:hypothetical protein
VGSADTDLLKEGGARDEDLFRLLELPLAADDVGLLAAAEEEEAVAAAETPLTVLLLLLPTAVLAVEVACREMDLWGAAGRVEGGVTFLLARVRRVVVVWSAAEQQLEVEEEVAVRFMLLALGDLDLFLVVLSDLATLGLGANLMAAVATLCGLMAAVAVTTATGLALSRTLRSCLSSSSSSTEAALVAEKSWAKFLRATVGVDGAVDVGVK